MVFPKVWGAASIFGIWAHNLFGVGIQLPLWLSCNSHPKWGKSAKMKGGITGPNQARNRTGVPPAASHFRAHTWTSLGPNCHSCGPTGPELSKSHAIGESKRAQNSPNMLLVTIPKDSGSLSHPRPFLDPNLVFFLAQFWSLFFAPQNRTIGMGHNGPKTAPIRLFCDPKGSGVITVGSRHYNHFSAEIERLLRPTIRQKPCVSRRKMGENGPKTDQMCV